MIELPKPMTELPVAKPDLSGNEESYVLQALRSSWISSSGSFVERFEKQFASICGTGAAIGVCNGTAALHLALLTLDVRPGDEVIVPSLTFVSTANAVRYLGAEPVFVDIDPDTWCIDPSKIEEAITIRTRGIIAVHLYGHPADIDPINRIAAIHGLWVVEDAAEAPCATYREKPVGSLARMATFSFYGNKVITSGEGGALTLNDPQLELRARTLKGQGVDPSRRYFFPITGYNFRLTNLACAILCAQLERLGWMIERRRGIYTQYYDELKETPGIGFQPVADWAVICPWLFSITIDPCEFGHTRDDAMARLSENGVDTRPFFRPLHNLPPFREGARARGTRLPITDQLAERGMNLPTFSQMTSDDISRVVRVIRDMARKGKR